ncbi:hypothetical protein GCM10010413_37510 [Promicromonospora sukumoe]|uniref:EthD domain-containing protein n=1 Tax=Promicromonospora sukumoe TaxID=88382 RepID=A0A7W3PDM7_9MICO|nr:EthD domain-containing protein [Promicromonospora sukumoe]MBA8807689.1 hypothetical protein [Promicromonospora sukumoe]
MPENQPELSLITVIRKPADVSTADFRHFMEHEYGPTYTRMPQVVSYTQHYVTDMANDGSEDPIDAVVQITFVSEDGMRAARDTDAYRAAHAARERYMRPTTAGIHRMRVERSLTPA